MRQIVYNSVKCLECNKVLVSRHRHDYVTCGCPNDADIHEILMSCGMNIIVAIGFVIDYRDKAK